MSMNYLPRIADNTLKKKLDYAGAVCIRGPKWCGKTSTAEQQAKSAVYMQDPDARNNNMLLAQTKPSLLLQGEQPHLIDEWQDAPQLWDAVRFYVDKEQAIGGYILTGSVVPGKASQHSGTGRFSFMNMRPMSLFESKDSTGEVSLRELFSRSSSCEGKSDTDIEEIAYLVCRGGWPRTSILSRAGALEVAYDYFDVLCNEDISRVDEIQRSPALARLILAEFARCQATTASFNAMRGHIAKRGEVISKLTFNSYISAIRKLYAIEELESWSTSLHAKARITKTPARFFVDPSIAAAALGASPDKLVKDASTLGMLFEGLCIRDLRVYAEANDGKVYRYHDSSGLEVDAIAELRDGSYGLIEIKLGASFVEAGVASLRKFEQSLDTSIVGKPAFMAVITPGGHAYQRDDGVYVVPISCLAP